MIHSFISDFYYTNCVAMVSEHSGQTGPPPIQLDLWPLIGTLNDNSLWNSCCLTFGMVLALNWAHPNLRGCLIAAAAAFHFIVLTSLSSTLMHCSSYQRHTGLSKSITCYTGSRLGKHRTTLMAERQAE